MGVTEDLAGWLVASSPDDVPADTVHEARRALVNIVGCALGGASHEAVDRTIAAFGPMFGEPTAEVLGRTERADPLHAALLNGITSHVEDFDDTLPRNYIHASSPVASALFAYASANGLSGRDLVHAFVLGFEVTSRLGNATYPAHYTAGWHSTGSVGVFGAAVAVGQPLGLDREQTVWAIGLAGTQAAGIREQFGSMGKALHPGRAAQSGYGAALLAREGFTSGAHGIEGPRGWASVTSAEHDLSKVTDGLGETWELHVNTYKPFPCGIVNHPAIDACIQLHDEHDIRPEDVAAMRLHVAPLVIDLCGKTDIRSGLEGKFSVVHGASVGLVRGRAGLREYTDEAVNDPDVKRVRERTTREADDPSVTEDGVHVEVELADGRVLEKRLEGSLGNLTRPLTDEQLSAKFSDQATLVLTEEQAERALELCWRIDELDDAAEVVRATIPRGRPMMEERLRYLLDRLEIQDVVHRYARGLDRHDDDVLRSVFHEDAIDNHGPWVGGREAFVDWANGPCHAHTDAHAHQITTHNVEIDGDVAHAESYCQWVHRFDDPGSVSVGGGRYVDRLERRDGEWRIVVRRLVIDYHFTAEGTVFGTESQLAYPKGTWDREDLSYERPLAVPGDVLARRVD